MHFALFFFLEFLVGFKFKDHFLQSEKKSNSAWSFASMEEKEKEV